jgi:hypothetical protein
LPTVASSPSFISLTGERLAWVVLCCVRER